MHPVLLKIGSLTITWFGVMMAVSFLAGMAGWVFIGRARGRNLDYCSDLVVWVMVSGILGARIAYVAANAGKYLEKPWEVFFIFQGGLIYYGGLVGAGAGLVVFALKRKERLLPLLDFAVTSVPLAHIFGRIGCFLNGCCFGKITQSRLSVRFPYDSQPWHSHVQQFPDTFVRFCRESLPVHPVQIYEALGNALIYVILVWSYRRRPADGIILCLYLILYPALRFFMEFLRGDPRDKIGPLASAQVISIFFLVLGAAILVVTLSRRKSIGTSGA